MKWNFFFIAKQHNGIAITELLYHLCFGLKKSLSWTKQVKTFVQSAGHVVRRSLQGVYELNKKVSS